VSNAPQATTVSQTQLPELTLTVSRNGSGPAVVLLHGFPGIGYSWRHQIPALATAGYQVIAPDQRGYGWSDQPEGVAAYSMRALVGDVIALLDHDGLDDAVIVGHDWGALIAPWVGLWHPERVKAIALLSMPYVPRDEISMLHYLRNQDPDGPMRYLLEFQESDAHEPFDADPMGVLRRLHWTLSGSCPEGWTSTDPLPKGLPAHLNQGEFENYFRAFARSGFDNPFNYFRNIEQNWEASERWTHASLSMPVTFIAGDRDFVVTTADGSLGSTVEAMNDHCKDLRGIHLIEGAGHWVQQEAPEQVNQLLLNFLESLDA